MFYSAHTLNLDTNEWSKTEFGSRGEATSYIDSQVKYPGDYNLKYTNGYWNDQAVYFRENKYYPKFRTGSIDFRRHWDFEKEKCLFEGFIIYKKPSEGIEFAVPCLYYWYLNYCPIPDKVKQKDDFAEIYDGDYHYFLYILRCILKRQFAIILKKRQSGYSLKNMAIKLNAGWFGTSAVCKTFAYDISKVEESWSFMEKYRDHINEHCGWKRGFDPNKKLDWQQRRRQTDGSFKGNNSTFKGFTTKQDYTNGVGGAAKIIYGEEFGVNPTGDLTHEFIRSNVSYGGLTTGLIMYSGAVGQLEHAEALKKFIIDPASNGFLSCTNLIVDDIEFGAQVGFFVPEWWNYVSVEEDEHGVAVGDVIYCYDEWGNTKRDLAIAEVLKWRKKEEQNKDPEKYRFYISQRPLSIKEAFAYRKESKFPARLVQAHKRRIEEKQYPVKYVDIVREGGELKFVPTNKLPITDFPVSKTAVNKEGCIVISEPPFTKSPELGKYYVASIDPVDVGATVTSESLFSLLIYKMDVEVERQGEKIEKFIEPGKIVCEWTGRFDDPNKNNEQAMLLLEMYGARAAVENNMSSFINYMMFENRTHYLYQKSELVTLKEIGANSQVFQEYGWRKTGKIFENHFIQMIVDFLKEELDREVLPDGKVVKIVYGIERIDGFPMIIREMEQYVEGVNVDRLVALGALIMVIKILIANRGYARRIEISGEKKKESVLAKPSSFFRNIGTQQAPGTVGPSRSPFKHLK